MSLSSDDKFHIGLGAILAAGGSILAIFKIGKHKQVSKTKQLFNKADQNSLNVNRSQLQLAKSGKQVHITIDNVMAHFLQTDQNSLNIVKNRYEEYMIGNSDKFQIVDKSNKSKYLSFVVHPYNSLINRNVIMPNLSVITGMDNEKISKDYRPMIISSTMRLGIVGVLSFNVNDGRYHIDAKIIGVSIGKIREWIDWENAYNVVMAIIGSGLALFGVYWAGKTIYDWKTKKPLNLSGSFRSSAGSMRF